MYTAISEKDLTAMDKKIATPLRGVERSLTIALLRAREATMNHFRPRLARHDLTEQQWRVIRVLADSGPTELDATEIAARSVILTPSLTRILRALEDRGIIVRSKADNDGRRWEISLTDDGRILFDAIAPQTETAYRSIEEKLGKEDCAMLLSLLEKLSAIEPDESTL